MKQFYKEIGMAMLMGLVVPSVVLGVMVSLQDKKEVVKPEPTFATEITESVQEKLVSVLTDDGTVQEMIFDDYLTGVVLAEMPANFETEAHKAQAVVARTYTLRAESRGGRHDDATVCTDHTCCQAYISEDEYLRRGGTKESVNKIRAAVEDTAGLVLTYDGELIEATYFSCSGGWTEDALAVWGTDVPYLQATSSPGEEHATHYTDTVTFAADAFVNALSLDYEGDPEEWISDIQYTSGGGVDYMVIQDVIFKGTVLRKLLNLRSTSFSIRVEGDTITITTRGFGHRVGMSQYGADAMAAAGALYPEILAHYYRGTSLEKLDN